MELHPTALLTLIVALGTGLPWRERVLAGWIAPRGIVAAPVAGLFGPLLLAHGRPDGAMLPPLVYALVLATVALHGLSIGALARRLGLAYARQHGVMIVGASPWTLELARSLQDLGVSVLLADASWNRLETARLTGIPTHWGEVLSELSEETLELGDAGYLLAATHNDAYNALVCTRFAPELGRNRVFQLSLHAAEEPDPGAFAHTLRGRIAFGAEAAYDELLRRHYQGWPLQRTRITERYTFEDVRRDAPAGTLVLLAARAGDTLLTLQPPAEGRAVAPARPSAGTLS